MKSITTIEFNGYISNNLIPTSIVENFNNDKYIIKDSCGQGFTHSILQIKNRTIILIVPLTAILKIKEQDRQDNHIFIYGGSKDTWKTVEIRLSDGEQLIISVTFDQLVLCKNQFKLIYYRLMDINWVVDEFQCLGESDYRENANEFYYMLWTDTNLPFILSTATPAPNFYDIPQQFRNELELYYFNQLDGEKPTLIIHPFKAWFGFLKHNAINNIPTAFFTNDKLKYKTLLNAPYFKNDVQILVGDKLAKETSKYRPKTVKEDKSIETGEIDNNVNLIVLSTAFAIGCDINRDMQFGIIMDSTNRVEAINMNTLYQSGRRIRKFNPPMNIFYKSELPDEKKGTTWQSIRIANQLKADNAVIELNKVKFDENFLTNIQPYLNTITFNYSYDRYKLKEYFESIGFKVEFSPLFDEIEKVRVTIQDQVRNIINQDIEVTSKYINGNNGFGGIRRNVQGDDPDYNGFSYDTLLAYSFGYIANYTGSEYLRNVPDRKDRILNKIKTYLDVRDTNNIDNDRFSKQKKSWTSLRQQQEHIHDGLDIFEDKGDDTFIYCKMIIEHLYLIDKAKSTFKMDKKTKEMYVDNNDIFPIEVTNIIIAMEIISKILEGAFVRAIDVSTGYHIPTLIETKNTEVLKSVNTKDFKLTPYFSNASRDIETAFKAYGLKFNDLHKAFLDDKTRKFIGGYKNPENSIMARYVMNRISIERQIDNYSNMLMYHLSWLIGGHVTGFKTTYHQNREYNPIVKVTRQLRGFSVYKMVTFDIKSEFASFIDRIVGSDIRFMVYNNVMIHFGCDRDKAKMMYNSWLNNHTKSIPDIKRFGVICGYTEEQLDKIIPIIRTSKGSFFRKHGFS